MLIKSTNYLYIYTQKHKIMYIFTFKSYITTKTKQIEFEKLHINACLDIAYRQTNHIDVQSWCFRATINL